MTTTTTTSTTDVESDDDPSLRMTATDSPDSTTGKSDFNESPALVICTSPDADYGGDDGGSPSMDEDKVEYEDDEPQNFQMHNRHSNATNGQEKDDLEKFMIKSMAISNAVRKRYHDLDSYRGKT